MSDTLKKYLGNPMSREAFTNLLESLQVDFSVRELRDALASEKKAASVALRDFDRFMDASGWASVSANEPLHRDFLRLRAHLALAAWEKKGEGSWTPADDVRAAGAVHAWVLLLQRLQAGDIYMTHHRARDRKAHPEVEVGGESVVEREMRAVLYDETGGLRAFFRDNPASLRWIHLWWLRRYAFRDAETLRNAADERSIPHPWSLYRSLPRLQAAILVGFAPFAVSKDAMDVLRSLNACTALVATALALMVLGFLVRIEVDKQATGFEKAPKLRVLGVLWRCLAGTFVTGAVLQALLGIVTEKTVAEHFAVRFCNLISWRFLVACALAALFGYILTLLFEDKSLADPF